MAKPQEVADNVAVMLDMAGRPQGAAAAAPARDLAPAGKAAAGDAEQQEQPNHSSSSSANAGSVMAEDGTKENGTKEEGAAAGFSAEEAAVLAEIRSVLQPVKDVTWPVGLTDNRK
jgi:hypothetical protein